MRAHDEVLRAEALRRANRRNVTTEDRAQSFVYRTYLWIARPGAVLEPQHLTGEHEQRDEDRRQHPPAAPSLDRWLHAERQIAKPERVGRNTRGVSRRIDGERRR